MSDMEAAVTVTLVDRYTPVMRRIVAVTKAAKSVMAAMSRAGGSGGNARLNSLRREEVIARKLRMEYGKLHGAMSRMKSAGSGLFSRGLMGTASVFAAKLGAASIALNQIMGPAVQMEKFQMQLEALEGSKAKGEAALKWITDFAVRTPLELPQVIEAYARMKAMGLDPTNGSLQALVDTMARSGKGFENLDSIILGMGQAWTKQKLQGDDARQLLEAGVPVWDLLAKKMGISAKEVMKMSEKGKLGRKEIQLLIDAMGEMAAGASERFAASWGGVLSNISDAWFQFRVQVADSGPFRVLKENLQQVLAEVQRMNADGSLKALAEKIGGNLADALNKGAQMAWGMYRAGVVVAGILEKIANAVGGYENLAMMAVGLWVVGKAMKVVVAAAEAAKILSTIAGLGGFGVAGGMLATAGGLAAIAGSLALIQKFEPAMIDKINSLRPDPKAPAKAPWLDLSQYDIPMPGKMVGADAAAAAGQLTREYLIKAIDDAKAAIRSKLEEIIGTARTVGPQMVSALASGLGSLYQVGVNWLQTLLDGIKAKVGEIVSYAAGIGASVKSAIGGIVGGIGTDPAGAAARGSGGGKAPPQPRAFGGSMSKGHTYQINERNQELMTPNRHMAITPISKLGGLGGKHVTVNMGGITINGNADQGALRKLADMIERKVQGALHDGAYATT